MPIYAYKCASCGYAKDALQKISDPPLTVCPQCGESALVKQVTAAGFQLKGSGWYVTDFRGGASSAGAPAEQEGKAAQAKPEQAKGEESGSGATKPEAKAEAQSAGSQAAGGGAAPAAAAPAPAPAKPAPSASND